MTRAEPDRAMLDWLDKHPECQVSYEGWDDDPRWEVYRVTGNRNDREWTCIGTGDTVRAAIVDAMENRRGERR